MATSNVTDEPNQAAETHLESYCSHFRVCIGKLRSIWKQVGNEADDCHSQVLVAAEQALAAWTQAVERAEAQRVSIKGLIQQHSAEIANIKAELDDGVESQSVDPDVNSEGEATLLRTLEALKGTLQFWRVKRASRMQAYEALMETHVSLKRQLGIRHKPIDDVDITTGALEYLQMENGKLMDEKGRRIAHAEELLGELRTVCRELGEDSSGAAAEVHPALVSLSAEKESAEVLGSVYKLVGSPSRLTSGGDLDLSDGMFDRLGAKIGDMQRLKGEREAQSRDVLEMLESLWSALSIPEDAPERAMVHKMLALDRPQRLHKRTLDKCLAEVNRLEGCKAQAMRDLALAKARELEQLCISTRISPPHTGPLLAELDRPGQMTQVLAKLVRLVAEVQAMSVKRAPILAQVTELLAAQADSAWLRSYNQNENRYKGRDASRNMQRAIKAAKLRERMAPMMEALLASLAEWELEEGAPFLYDEQVLQDTQLKAVEAELEQMALEKVPRPKPASSMPSPSAPSGKPPASRSTPSTAARGSAAPVPRAPTSSGGGAPSDRPSLTPRSAAGGEGAGAASGTGGRRLSLATSSARDPGVFRGPGGAGSGNAHLFTAAGGAAGKVVMRSGDFAPGALRALAAQHVGTSSTGNGSSGGVLLPESSFGSRAAAPTQTPPHGPAAGAGRRSTAGSSPALAGTGGKAGRVSSGGGAIVAGDNGGDEVSSVTAPTASGVKNSAQDLFRRYLGDTATDAVSSKPTPTKVVTPSSARAVAKLTFSTAVSTGALTPGAPVAASVGAGTTYGGEDDGADDVQATKCDTPKSTASSRARQQQAQHTKPTPLAAAVLSPETKASRIPRVRM